MENTEVFQCSRPLYIHRLLHYQRPTLEWHIYYILPTLTHNYHPQILDILGFALGIVHSRDFDKCIMTCICYYSVMQNCFTALKILCVLPTHPFLFQPVATRDLFTVSIVLPLSECNKVEITQYVSM